MTENKPKTITGRRPSMSFSALDTEAGLLDGLCLATAGEAEVPLKRKCLKKARPNQHSVEIVKQLIEFIKTL
jgi:hypothetical protein